MDKTPPFKGPRARTRELRERYGLTARDLAEATGADERSVRRWPTQTENRRSPVDDRIRRLEKIIWELAGAGLPPNAIRAWLREPAEYLNEKSPLAALGEADFDAVAQFVAVSTLGVGVGLNARGEDDQPDAPERLHATHR